MPNYRRYAGLVLSTLTVALLAGCSGTTLNSNPISAAVATTRTQTVITDAPSNQVLSLALTVNSIVMTDAAGKQATVLSTPVTIEASHLDAVHEPLLPPLNIPQDTYVSATITVSNPTVVYVDTGTGKAITASATLASTSTTVTFSNTIVVGTTATPIVFDLLVGQSVAISGTTVTVTPTFNVTQIAPMQQPTNQNNGKIAGVFGQVVSVSGTTLTLTIPNGSQLAIATNSSTQLQGFSTLSALTAGELVDVDVAEQTDGSLLALRIHIVPAVAASLYVGPVTAVTGSPATSFTQVVREQLTPGATAATGTTETVTITSATTFGTAMQAGTLPALSFTPTFNASTMIAGQRVAVAAASVSGTTVTAGSVTLAPQTVNGTIAAMTTTGGVTVYTVTLAADSALALLTGKTTVYVYAGNGTQMMNAAPVSATDTARFNGLLFNDGGTLRLVALTSCDPPATAPHQTH